MRFESSRETSTPLPEPSRPGEIADRGSVTSMRGFCCARYTPGFSGPGGRFIFDLEERDVDDRS